MPQLGIEHLSFGLLLLTTYLGIQTQIFQRRTSIREALEQMDQMNHAGYSKMKPVLQSFSYRGPWSSTTVAIKIRTLPGGDYASTISTPDSPYWWKAKGMDTSEFQSAIENLPGISRAQIRKHDFILSINSGNPSEVRRYVERVMHTIRIARENR